MLRYTYIACHVIFSEGTQAFNKEVLTLLASCLPSFCFIGLHFEIEIGLDSVVRVKVKSQGIWIHFSTFIRCFLTSARRWGSGHSCSCGNKECAESLLADHCGGGPVHIYTFPSRAHAPVFAHTKFLPLITQAKISFQQLL